MDIIWFLPWAPGHQVSGLGVPVRKIPEILKEAADELKRPWGCRWPANGTGKSPSCGRSKIQPIPSEPAMPPFPFPCKVTVLEQEWKTYGKTSGFTRISPTKPHESHWKTNGFKAFLLLNLMNPFFGFAAATHGFRLSGGLFINMNLILRTLTDYFSQNRV